MKRGLLLLALAAGLVLPGATARDATTSSAEVAAANDSLRTTRSATGASTSGNRELHQSNVVYTNSLGMKFVPVPDTDVLFSIWLVRVQDYQTYADSIKDVNTLWRDPPFAQGATHPVVIVSWNEAKAFCNWLSQKEGKNYRLPTDEEWSVAVGLDKGTKDTYTEKDGKISGVFPWGSQWPPPPGAGNYADRTASALPFLTIIKDYDDGFRGTSPVGSFKPNKFGLYDMGGNVWQWCEDWYDEKQKVSRGGCWSSGEPLFTCSAARMSWHPEGHTAGTGFRCVLASFSQPLTATNSPTSTNASR